MEPSPVLNELITCNTRPGSQQHPQQDSVIINIYWENILHKIQRLLHIPLIWLVILK